MVKAALANVTWWLGSAASCGAFVAALEDPAREQERILHRLLRENAATAFGREHGFADIRSDVQFARRVPPRDYDELRPWIDRITRGEAGVLTADPVRRLVPTGGSTAARKLIPYTRAMQAELNRAINPWIFDLYRREPRALLGASYWSVTPAGEPLQSTAPTAVPIGFDDDADYLGGWRRRLVASAMAVPAQLRTIRSFEAWRYVTLLMLLRRSDLSLISIWHPSFFSLLLRALHENWPKLLSDVSSGGCAVLPNLPESIAKSIAVRPDPSRAKELSRTGPASPARIWPRLCLLSCWADANAFAAAAELAASLPGIHVQPKGLLATEGAVSIPYGGMHPLAIRSHYLEFEDQAGRTLPASELRIGHTYSVLLTTGAGLYRYRLNDLVVVTGNVGRTPSVRFVGRGNLISDRFGEKLSETFVLTAFARLFANLPAVPPFTLLAPDIDAAGCRYTLYVSEDLPPDLAGELDDLLSSNPSYAYCRRLGQLLPPRVTRVAKDSFTAYARRLTEAGQRLGDIKPAALSPLDSWSRYLQLTPEIGSNAVSSP